MIPEEMKDELIDLLTRLLEYMENKSDVVEDMSGKQRPNEEMKFSTEIEEAIGKLEKQVK
jgi:hypothetical protein